MGRKSRKFIDKKHDVVHSFKIVQRSQQDPLIADETAPQGVLIDTECSDSHKEELLKYGVYFDDEYDYLQHLRGVKEAVDWEAFDDVEVYTIRNEAPKINKKAFQDIGLVLPSSAFESYVEEPIGLLNKAAPVTGPRPELDPDIVAELDSDSEEDEDMCDPEDASGLPDNFVSLLNSDTYVDDFEEKGEYEDIEQWLGGTGSFVDKTILGGSSEEDGATVKYSSKNVEWRSNESGDESDNECYSDFFVSDEEADDVPDLCSNTNRYGAKSNITSRTSASSATVPRSELLSVLDEKFERMFNAEYTDEQIGALDGEVIEGVFEVGSEVFQQAVHATKKQFEKDAFNETDENEKNRTIQWVKNNLKLRNYLQDEKEEVVTMEVKTKPKYDCESIISTYSTTKNRPRLIDDSHLFSKKKNSGLTRKAIKKHNEEELGEELPERDVDTHTILTCISAVSIRPKDETPEERRDRKCALKELRRERRKEKKLNKISFKEELKKQKKIHLSKPTSRIIPVV